MQQEAMLKVAKGYVGAKAELKENEQCFWMKLSDSVGFLWRRYLQMRKEMFTIYLEKYEIYKNQVTSPIS